MFKKILAFALSATCILGVFAGCDSENKKADIEIKTKEDAKTVAEEVLKKAKNGDDFDTLINKYGTDPGTADYPLGYTVTKGQMVQEFEDASYALDIDAISNVVETSYGYHIIKRYAFDNEFYEDDANKSQLNTIYNSYVCDSDFNALLDSLKPTYEEGYENITIANIDEYTNDTVFKLEDLSVPTSMFRYFLLNLANDQDQGDRTYWDNNADAAGQVKTQAETLCTQYIAIEIFAKNNNTTLTDDDNTTIQSQIDQAIEQEGGQDKFEETLTKSYLDEATFRTMISIQLLQNDIYTNLCGDTVDESVPVDDILTFLNDTEKSGVVRVKHVLISLPEEEETTTSAADTTLSEDTTSSAADTTISEDTTAPESTTTAK